MLFCEINSFFESSGEVSLRRTHMLGALTPSTRRQVLISSGLQFGDIELQIFPGRLLINICSESTLPPIDWWNYSGDVWISSSSSPMTACKIVALVKQSWRCGRVPCLELKHEDEVEEDAQKAILQCLNDVCDDVFVLRLENYYLNFDDTLPTFSSLSNLCLTGFRGPLPKWARVLNDTTEQVEICDSRCFATDSFAHLNSNKWNRLILDNTNVTASNLDHLHCAQKLKTLSLVDCRQIDSFDATAFPELLRLLMSRTPISSDSFTGIESCRHLQLINLGGCHDISDINALGRLKALREIFVHETGVTNEGIIGLAGCENLEKLNLGGCRYVSNVNQLGQLTALKELHLWSTKVSNTGIRDLCHCSSLTELVLDDCTRITDVATLGRLGSLRWLSLIGTEVTGHGIKELIHCCSLESLALAGTRIEKPPKLWRHETIVEYLSVFQ